MQTVSVCHLVGGPAVATVLKVVVENRLDIAKMKHLRERDWRNEGHSALSLFKMRTEISVVERIYLYSIISFTWIKRKT